MRLLLIAHLLNRLAPSANLKSNTFLTPQKYLTIYVRNILKIVMAFSFSPVVLE